MYSSCLSLYRCIVTSSMNSFSYFQKKKEAQSLGHFLKRLVLWYFHLNHSFILRVIHMEYRRNNIRFKWKETNIHSTFTLSKFPLHILFQNWFQFIRALDNLFLCYIRINCRTYDIKYVFWRKSSSVHVQKIMLCLRNTCQPLVTT